MVRGVKLLRSQNLNLFPPTVLTRGERRFAGRGAPQPAADRPPHVQHQRTGRTRTYGNIHQVSSSSSSTYHGMQVMMQKRFSRGFQFRANYTFSKAIDDASDFTQSQQPPTPTCRAPSAALSTEDQRHRFTLAGVWNIPYAGPGKGALGGWSLSSIWTFRSGTPENVTTGADSNPTATPTTARSTASTRWAATRPRGRRAGPSICGFPNACPSGRGWPCRCWWSRSTRRTG